MQGPLPLNGLKAFEAAARHLSFTRAADELHVTQAAVSHQVKTLEQRLGVKLFRRLPKSLLLTDEGQALLPELHDAFERMARAVNRVTSAQGGSALSVSTLTTFALSWLVSRLPRFQARHPAIEVRLNTTARMVDFTREDVDVAVRYGDGNWPGLDTVRLSSEQLFAVCSPKLLSGKRRISKPADILKFPLIHMDSRADWNNWLQEAGLDESAVTHGPVLNRASMVIDAAINGQGIALARTTLAAWDLLNGHLVRPFAQSLPLAKTYWIICPKATAGLPKIVTFRDWLLAEASSDLLRLKKLPAGG